MNILLFAFDQLHSKIFLSRFFRFNESSLKRFQAAIYVCNFNGNVTNSCEDFNCDSLSFGHLFATGATVIAWVRRGSLIPPECRAS